MKNIKLYSMVLAQLFVIQLVMGQSQTVQTDENGRELGTVPQQVVDKAEETTPQRNGDDLTEIDDADIPGTYYLGGGGVEDVIIGEEKPKDLIDRLDNMEAELSELRLNNERLLNENENMHSEMSNCCAEAASNLETSRSYLLQNSPNPFQAGTNIQYFIAEYVEGATIGLYNVEGTLLKTFDIDQTGMGELQVDRNAISKGSYVYTLSVDGKIIDSKVMVLQ